MSQLFAMKTLKVGVLTHSHKP